MAAHRALRLAGGPRRVDERPGVLRRDGDGWTSAARAGDQYFIGEDPGRRRAPAEMDQAAGEDRAVADDRLDAVEQIVLDDQGACRAVVENVANLLFAQTE